MQDPFTAERKLLKIVSGLEYGVDLFGNRLAGVVFIQDQRNPLHNSF